jgi:N-acyl-D-amino-acid deacylase
MPSRRTFLASVAALGLSRPAAAGTPDPDPFDQLLTTFLTEHAGPGAALAVARNGKLVYARGYGYADAEAKRPAQPATPFRVASISKPVTAVGVLMLVDRGKVKLDEPALRYFDLKPFPAGGASVDERWKKVTVRQCLRHTGGWDRNRRGGFDPIAIPGRIASEMKLHGAPTPEDVVRYMMGRPLDFDPGERYAYSNLGYLVLGRVIEGVTGERYEPWVRRHVLAPVGAGGMYLGRGLPEDRPTAEARYYDSKKRTRACLYPPRVGAVVPLPDGAENIEAFEAHGGWVASAIDLVRFASAFDSGKPSPLLSADAIREMWARPEGAAGHGPKGRPRDVYYGCGWSVRPVGDAGKANTWHTGLIAGTSALLVRRWDGLNWAVLFNTEANPKGDVLSGLIDGPMHHAANAVKAWPG